MNIQPRLRLLDRCYDLARALSSHSKCSYDDQPEKFSRPRVTVETTLSQEISSQRFEDPSMLGWVSNMPPSPRDSRASRQGTESKKSSRPDPKAVQASSPQLFRCPNCSAVSFRVLFRDRDVAGFCTQCNLQVRTDRKIGRATREYYAEFNRQVVAAHPGRIERIFLKMNSVSEAKKVYPVVRRLGYRTRQSSPMLHARLVMVETTRDHAVILIENLRLQGMHVSLQDDFSFPQEQALSAR
jgi:transcription elongation factor Elf1